MSVAAAGPSLAVQPLEALYEEPGLPAFALPGELGEAYGGPLGFASPRLFANFVASIDGVVALPGELQSSHLIAAASEADRFVMGLLRACADAVLVGAGTLRGSPRSHWTAAHAYPPAAELYAELRRARGLPPQPTLAVLSGRGTVDPAHPGLVEPSLVLTSEQGAQRLDGRLPHSAALVPVGDAPTLDPVAAVAALHDRGHQLILCEGGPVVLAALVAAGLVDELFLTVSPVLAGRHPSAPRPSLIEGAELLPGRNVAARLLSLRRSGSHLFLRYAL